MKIKAIRERGWTKSFDEILLDLVMKGQHIPASLLGSLKGKTKSFSIKERDKIWEDSQK